MGTRWKQTKQGSADVQRTRLCCESSEQHSRCHCLFSRDFSARKFLKCFPEIVILFSSFFGRNGNNQFSAIHIGLECNSRATSTQRLFICCRGRRQAAPDDIRPLRNLFKHHFTISANVLVRWRRRVTSIDNGINDNHFLKVAQNASSSYQAR